MEFPIQFNAIKIVWSYSIFSEITGYVFQTTVNPVLAAT